LEFPCFLALVGSSRQREGVATRPVRREIGVSVVHVFQIILMLLVGFVAWAPAQHAAPDAVGVDLTAFVITVVVDHDGNVSEAFTQAEAAFPGQVVEYRLLATNRSAAATPAGRGDRPALQGGGAVRQNAVMHESVRSGVLRRGWAVAYGRLDDCIA